MGKYEILDWLKVQRLTGNDAWFRQAEVLKGMRRDGFRVHPSTLSRAWPDMLCHRKEWIEYRAVGEWYDRHHEIRHRKSECLHTSDMKKNIHNNGIEAKNSGRNTPRAEVLKADRSVAAGRM